MKYFSIGFPQRYYDDDGDDDDDAVVKIFALAHATKDTIAGALVRTHKWEPRVYGKLSLCVFADPLRRTRLHSAHWRKEFLCARVRLVAFITHGTENAADAVKGRAGRSNAGDAGWAGNVCP